MHDIGAHCNLQGTPIFHCSLDAVGAYDDIPHTVLFDSVGALPDHCWRLMENWYSDLYAKIMWNNQLSEAIPILGTRQGGLSSPVLFNMFYKSLIIYAMQMMSC